MVPKVIKTPREYEAALERVETLMDAKLGTAESDELELFVTLIELYEDKHYPIDLPDPISAIRFRMEQSGLKQQDLVQYIGSRGKVSEVLNGKRPLSLKMIRSLHVGLGIPADVLLQEPGAAMPEDLSGIDCGRFPLKDMVERGWFPSFRGKLSDVREHAEELVRGFLEPALRVGMQPALLRQHVRAGSTMDEHALLAWSVRVVTLAQEQSVPEYQQGSITNDFLKQLVNLSYMDAGPKLAKEFLAKNGIHLVTLNHLPKTHLDGAAMILPSGSPVVAITLRHDRLDNFWFTLFHELAHISLHFEKDGSCWFVDDLDAAGDKTEQEADKFAADALIPATLWRYAAIRKNPVAADVRRFAEKLRIHPAIVAGRIRREQGSYKILSPLVGHHEVRKHFPSSVGDGGA